MYRLRRPSIAPRLRQGLLLGALSALLVCLGSALGWLHGLEQRTLDLLFRARGPRYPSPDIVLLVADDATIARAGRWPLPRRIYADVVRRLHRAGAKTIAFDVQFSIPSDSPADDEAFARACQEVGRVVQAAVFHVPSPNDSTLLVRMPVMNPPLPRFRITDRQAACRWAAAGTAARPALQSSAVAVGHLNVYPEPDGKLRRIPHLIRYRQGVYPSLALAAAGHFMGLTLPDIVAEGKANASAATTGEVHLGVQRMVPVDVNGETWINWIGGNRSFPTYSFNELFDGKVPAERFKNSIVLIGITYPGAAQYYATPFSPTQPAVELQANALDDILMDRPLQEIPAWMQICLLFTFSILASGLIAQRGALGSTAWMFTIAAALWLTALILLARGDVYLPIARPLLAVLLSFALVVSYQQIRDAQALRRSEERYRTIVDTAQEGIWMVDAQDRTSYVNERMATMLGYSVEEMQGRSLFDFMDDDARAEFIRKFSQSRQKIREQDDLRFRRKDGSGLWTIVSSTPIHDDRDHFVGFLHMVTDITERKKNEQKLAISREKLVNLAARVRDVQEQERTRIAREIHDELGQALTGLKLDLTWLERSLLSSGKTESVLSLRDKIKVMSGHLDSTIEAVQEIATQLRPGVLDDLGLEAAIEWQAWDFQERSGIVCEFVSHLDNTQINQDASTALFRIAQEALTNILRHANATHVRIELKQESENVILKVQDNGRGITQGEIISMKSLGLLGMRERARLLGGDLTINGSEGQGTTIRAHIPLPGKSVTEEHRA